ncbi:MAG: hypothetical protein B7Z29_21175 [Hyphomicrobium sp. 12-62-95]|nr:MAG: hypothetical protein B7Z29_21175 [Hyphomicrobium sp. 12-62-95]
MVVLLAYSAATASPDQQMAILNGIAALKESVLDACRREKSPCTDAVQFARSALSSSEFTDRRHGTWLEQEE